MFFKKKCPICGGKNPKDAVACVSCGAPLTSRKLMVLDSGYLSSDFVTTPELTDAVIDDPYILITDKKISDVADLSMAMEKILQVTANLLIVAEEVDGEALATMVAKKLQGILNVVAIEAPATGVSRKEVLQDIADYTGGMVISDRMLGSVTVEDLGRARRVRVDENKTTIVDGKGKRRD